LFLHEVLYEKRFDSGPRIATAGINDGIDISLDLTCIVGRLHLVRHWSLPLETQTYPTRTSTRYKNVHVMFFAVECGDIIVRHVRAER
jgi:hypothetical protein